MYEQYTHTTEAELEAKADDYRAKCVIEYEERRDSEGNPMAPEWVERKADRDRKEFLKKELKRQNKTLYAFVEIPVALLDTIIPKSANLPWSKIQETEVVTQTREVFDPETELMVEEEYDVVVPVFNEDDEPVMRQKTLNEYLITQIHSLDGTKSLILLAGMEAPTYRRKGIKESELGGWHDFLDPLGYGNTTWMDRTAAGALATSEAYTTTGTPPGP